jgi:hypothetical protein
MFFSSRASYFCKVDFQASRLHRSVRESGAGLRHGKKHLHRFQCILELRVHFGKLVSIRNEIICEEWAVHTSPLTFVIASCIITFSSFTLFLYSLATMSDSALIGPNYLVFDLVTAILFCHEELAEDVEQNTKKVKLYAH